MADIVDFWPEGFLYTNFCVSAISAVYEQEFGEAPAIDKCADDLRTWWSYRENVSEMPAYAVAFLDRFLGAEPNWLLPDDPRSRPAMAEALEAPTEPRLIPSLTGQALEIDPSLECITGTWGTFPVADKLVIFDCDGVLVDSEPLAAEAYERVYEKHGMSGVGAGIIAQCIGMKQADIW